MANKCAINGDNHRYFVFKTMVEFVPYQSEAGLVTLDKKPLYERVEYAYLGCNCGSSVKSKVKELQYGEE